MIFNSNNNHNINNIKIVYYNINSINLVKKQALQLTILNYEQQIKQQIHIICLCECKVSVDLNSEDRQNLLALPNYKFEYFPSRDKSNGGLLFYIHNSINYQNQPEFSIPLQKRLIYSSDIRWIKLNSLNISDNHCNQGGILLVGLAY